MPPKSLSTQTRTLSIGDLHDRLTRLETLIERLLHIEPCSGNPSATGASYAPQVIYDEAAHYAKTFLSGHS